MPNPAAPSFFMPNQQFSNMWQQPGQTGAAVAGKNAGASLQQLGPKSSLTEECKKYPGNMILFHDNNGTPMCEQCFAEKGKPKEEKVDAMQLDLISRLKNKAQNTDQDKEEADTRPDEEIIKGYHQ
jgi:hypothetical protein